MIDGRSIGAPLKEKLKNEMKTYLDLNDNGKMMPSVLWDALKAVIGGN